MVGVPAAQGQPRMSAMARTLRACPVLRCGWSTAQAGTPRVRSGTRTAGPGTRHSWTGSSTMASSFSAARLVTASRPCMPSRPQMRTRYGHIYAHRAEVLAELAEVLRANPVKGLDIGRYLRGPTRGEAFLQDAIRLVEADYSGLDVLARGGDLRLLRRSLDGLSAQTHQVMLPATVPSGWHFAVSGSTSSLRPQR
jgi:hypothetical protein